MKKKLVFVLPTFNPGGAENVMIRLANHFSHHYDVSILAISTAGALRDTVLEGIPVTDLQCQSVKSSFLPVRKALNYVDPDVVFSSISRLNILLSIVNLSRRKKFHLVLREVNTPSVALKAIRFGALYKLLSRLLYPLASSVICQSRNMMGDMQKEYAMTSRNLVQIYNPLNEKYLQGNGEPPPNPYESETTVNLLAAGRLEPQKGFDLLITSIHKVVKKHKDLKLYIVGDGPLRAELQKQIDESELQSHVILAGFKKELLPYLYHANLVVSSSRYEGLPNILIESIATGTPVVATNCPGGTAEIVKPEINGYLAGSISSDSLAESIDDFLTSPFEYDRASVKATVDRFLPETIYSQYHRLFQQVLSQGTGTV